MAKRIGLNRRKPSVREQIEKTLPDRRENSWYKRFGKPLKPAAIKRAKLFVISRLPRTGEKTFIHTHALGSSIPTPEDIIGFIKQMNFGVNMLVMAPRKGKKIQGYTLVKAGKNTKVKEMFSCMKKLAAKGEPKTLEESKRQAQLVISAIKRYGFLVRIVPMPGFVVARDWPRMH